MKLDKDFIIIMIIVIAGLGGGVFTAYQYYESSKSDKEAKQAQAEALDKADKLIQANEKLIQAQEKAEIISRQNNEKLDSANKELSAKSEELIKMQSELISLQNETIKTIYGDGYCEVRTSFDEVNRKVKFTLKSLSNYNIYNISIHSINFSDLKKYNTSNDSNIYKVTNENYLKSSHRDNVNSLSPKFFVALPLQPTISNELYYIFKVSSDNMTTIQYTYIHYNRDLNNIAIFYRIANFDRVEETFTLIKESDNKMDEVFWTKNFPYLKNSIHFH